ncbi:hypothetical protein GCM10009836_60330 [Pseudonocardia ailaonensis]|uniref:DUF4333 domain-containing protein n=1 Tax=Pseudonocardia ailaonensis TaxID=367279 RepID=A0ABN2NM65_9PSEU
MLVAGLMLLAGCSQAAAIAPVSGGREALVRFAGNDVLVAQQVAVLEAPVCAQAGEVVTCSGSTVDGQEIKVAAPAGDPATMTVTVGSRTLYDGPVQAVVDKAGRP